MKTSKKAAVSSLRALASLTLILLTFFTACGQTTPPSSLDALKKLSLSDEAARASEVAPGAWEDGKNYLNLAEEAAQEGRIEKADRFATLGIIQLKTAFATALEADAGMRLETAEKERQALDRATATVTSNLREIETQLERIALREHLVALTDKTERRAAARESKRIESLSKAEQATIEKARRIVGREMLSRIDVWNAVLEIFVSNKHIPPEKLAILDGETRLAETALKELDLLSLQEHVENVGIKSRRLIDEAWYGKEGMRKDVLDTIAVAVSDAGLREIEEDFALSSAIRFPSMKKMKKAKSYTTLKAELTHEKHVQMIPVKQRKNALLLIVALP